MTHLFKALYSLSFLSVAVCFVGLFAVNHGETSLALCIPAGICGMMGFGCLGMIVEDTVKFNKTGKCSI